MDAQDREQDLLSSSQEARNTVNNIATSTLGVSSNNQENFLNVTLSTVAQERLRNQLVNGTGADQATSFIQGYLEEFDLDFENLSQNAKDFLSDVSERITNVEGGYRDIATDYAEQQSSEEEVDVFTLVGEQQRFRVRIETNDEGQRQLSILDVNLKINQTDLFVINLDENRRNILVERTSKELSPVNYGQQNEETRSTSINLYEAETINSSAEA